MKFATHRSAARRLALCWVPALLSLVGCGRGEYEAGLNEAIVRLKVENQFKMLDPAATVLAAWKADQGPTGTKVTFRKPLIHNNVQAFTATTMNPNNPAEPLPANRLKPPFLQNFPGFTQTWERARLAGRNDSAAILTVGAQAAEPGVLDRVLADLKAAFPDLPPETQWSKVAVQTPVQGKSVDWNSLSFNHELALWYTSDIEPIKIKGTVLILMREEQGRQVFLGAQWTDTAGDLGLRKQEVLGAAGTVQVALGVKID